MKAIYIRPAFSGNRSRRQLPKVSLRILQQEFRRGMALFLGSSLYVLSATVIQARGGETASPWVSPVAVAGSQNQVTLADAAVVNEEEETDGEEASQLGVEEKGCGLAGTFSPEVLRWETKICEWSAEHQMEPNLIATVMQIESCGDPTAVSATGVRGLFQVTGANLDGQNPFDPNVSMAKGPGKVLKQEIAASGGNIVAAMAGYNGGGYARKYISGELSRGQFYWFLRNHASGNWWSPSKAEAKINEVEYYAQWAGIYFEAAEGRRDTLQRWLDKGGSRLCEAASRVPVEL